MVETEPDAKAETQSDAMDGPRRGFLAVALALLVALPVGVLWSSLGGAYQLDDVYRIETNHELERVHPVWRHFTDPSTGTSLPSIEQYRPLLPLTLSMTAWAGDRLGVERVVAHRAGNLGVHALTAVLVFLLLCELLRHGPPRVRDRRGELALIGGLLFALHPVATLPVQYLCARDLGLANLFLVAAVLVYARMRRVRGDSALGWICVLGLVGLSLLAKTNAAVFFGLVLASELTLGGRDPWHRDVWLRTALAALVTAAFFGWTRVLGFSDAGQLVVDDKTWLQYGRTELRVHVFHYLRNAVWPLHLRPLPDVELRGWADPGVLVGAVVVGGSLVGAWLARRRRPLVAFAVFAYWVLFALTSSAIPLRSLATDYRQAPSLVFLVLLFVAGPLPRLPRPLMIGATAGALAALAFLSFRQGETWRTPLALWSDAVAKGTTGRGHQNYAREIQATDPVLAEDHYQIALRADPNDVFARINLGLLRIDRGRIADGMAEIEKAAYQSPDWAIVQHWLAFAQRRVNAQVKAAQASTRAAELDGGNPEYLYWAAFDRQVLGQHAAALPWLETLRETHGAFNDSLYREAWSLFNTGRADRAIPLYEAFVEEQANHAGAWFNLGVARQARTDFRGAISAFERALELVPTYHEAHFHLANCWERLGDPARAAEHQAAYDRAVEARLGG